MSSFKINISNTEKKEEPKSNVEEILILRIILSLIKTFHTSIRKISKEVKTIYNFICFIY